MSAGLRVIKLALPALLPIWLAAGATAKLTPAEIAGAARVESLTIPTPGEFFAAIAKIERPNWGQLIRPTILPGTTSRARMSLALGERVADGFIAVEAQDGQQVKNIGKDIMSLARQLGVSQSVLARGNSITDFAENNEWSALKEELEATQNEVKLQMAEQKDQYLISLVTLGAWIRGMQTATDIVMRNYAPESAKLIRQPAVVDYLVGQMAGLPQRMQDEPLVRNVRAGLEKASAIVHFDTATVPSIEQVADLQKIVTAMIDEICGPPAPAPSQQ